MYKAQQITKEQLLPLVLAGGLGAIILAFAIKKEHPLISDVILTGIGTGAAFASIITMFKVEAA